MNINEFDVKQILVQKIGITIRIIKCNNCAITVIK